MAYKAKTSFSDPDKYRIFLKKQLLSLNPEYYVITQRKQIQTPDGIMYTIRIVRDIEIPNLDPIAECWINSTLIYLWRNSCWAIAVDKFNRPIISTTLIAHAKHLSISNSMAKHCSQWETISNTNLMPKPKDKTIIIHKIGSIE